jgi:hypothetical protein
MHGAESLIRRRLHRKQRDDLEQVILNHVPQATRTFIEGAATLDAEILSQRDLNSGDTVAIPDGLEKGIGESEVEDIHDGLFSEIVIDAKNRVFRKHRMRDSVQFACGSQIAAERLFDDHAGIVA